MRLSGSELLELGLYVMVALVGGFILAVILEVLYAAALLAGGSGFEDALLGTVAAGGVIEPVTTKLVPALFVTFMARSQVPRAAEVLGDRWILAGIGLGLAIGLMEFATRIPLFTGVEGGLTLAGCALAPALLVHPLEGLLVAAGAIRLSSEGSIRTASRRSLALLGLGLLAAMAFHVWWNTGGAVTVVSTIDPACASGFEPSAPSNNI